MLDRTPIEPLIGACLGVLEGSFQGTRLGIPKEEPLKGPLSLKEALKGTLSLKEPSGTLKGILNPKP